MKQARQIVETLAKAGFIAYYAGGWVRDLLLKRSSDDIDIATNAPPETVQALFPQTVPVGIAFGIVLVILDGRQYEVATFRQDLDYKDGRRPSRVEFTTAIEDARRRDFTINGMFYDPIRDEVLDYVGGKTDLEAKIIRAIGDPHERIREDRLRMIRAVRLACRFQFHIEEKTRQAILAHAKELFPAVAMERVYQEFKKGQGTLHCMLLSLHEHGLLTTIFPNLANISFPQIAKRLEPLKNYPDKAPVIASLLPLFPNSTLDEDLQLCQYLKLSNQDQEWVLFLRHARKLVQLSVEDSEWAHFYANDLSSLSLSILSAHLKSEEQTPFLKEHEERIKSLTPWIERIRRRDPIVKSEDLFKEGIKAGPDMGKLLKEAERISINEQLQKPALIIEKLKKNPKWPGGHDANSSPFQ